ncbi:unnamed protein product [Somion occarium]|uniref:Uncharacterized protein n=1 Tax=Somion occarium TaxID=3059160 RepID=A0ABP1DG40_9APHY
MAFLLGFDNLNSGGFTLLSKCSASFTLLRNRTYWAEGSIAAQQRISAWSKRSYGASWADSTRQPRILIYGAMPTTPSKSNLTYWILLFPILQSGMRWTPGPLLRYSQSPSRSSHGNATVPGSSIAQQWKISHCPCTRARTLLHEGTLSYDEIDSLAGLVLDVTYVSYPVSHIDSQVTSVHSCISSPT